MNSEDWGNQGWERCIWTASLVQVGSSCNFLIFYVEDGNTQNRGVPARNFTFPVFRNIAVIAAITILSVVLRRFGSCRRDFFLSYKNLKRE